MRILYIDDKEAIVQDASSEMLNILNKLGYTYMSFTSIEDLEHTEISYISYCIRP